MNTRLKNFGVAALLLTAVLVVPSFAKSKTYSGTVSDAMCGAKHAMPGDAASCTRACVAKGSKYALVVDDKVYTLDTADKDALSALDKAAGSKVSVEGEAKGDTIMVKSVKAM